MTTSLPLFPDLDSPQPSSLEEAIQQAGGLAFNGEAYEEAFDRVRLSDQAARVLAILQDGQPWSVPDIAKAIEARFHVTDLETSISCQIRNLRKATFGGYHIPRISTSKREFGFWKFQLVERNS